MTQQISDCQLDDILDYIYHADDLAIQEIISSITDRYETRFPDWDVILLSLHKDPEKRKDDVARIIDMLQNRL